MHHRERLGLVCAVGLVVVGCGGEPNDSGPPGASGNAGSGGFASGGSTGWPSGGSGGAGQAGQAGQNGQAGQAAGGSGGDIGDPVIPTAHPRIYLNQDNKKRLQTALGSSTKSATRFKNMVDAELAGGDVYDYQSWFSALLYVVTGEAKYGAHAVETMDDFVASEEALVASGERASVAYDSYLEVGPRIGDLALTFDYCYDLLTADQKKRWIVYANQAVWNVWHHEQASWGGKAFPWSGWSVDNPNNNYYFSFLRATMLLGLATAGDNDQADGHLKKFREDKIGAQLVPAYLADLPGGGSREGTGYGTAMANLFRLYDIWAATTGEHIADLTPHARESIGYLLHAIVPTRDRLAPIGDHSRDATAALFDYHRDYLQVLASLYPNDETSAVARGFLPTSSVPEMSLGFMYHSDYIWDVAGQSTAPLTALYPVYHATGTGTIFARTGWTADATWASFIAGPYTESHAHHDQGSLLVYKREWLAYDANVDSHSGIHAEEETHNLVRVESAGKTVRMMEGATPSKLVALEDTKSFTWLASDTTSIYAGKAPIAGVQRGVLLIKPNVFVVFDRVATSSTTARKVWQLNTPIAPSVSGSTATLQGKQSKLRLYAVSPSGAAVSSKSWPGLDADMQGGYRLEIAHEGATVSYFLTVLSLDDAVTSATASNSTGQRGVSLKLGDGRSALVRFAETGASATLLLQSASGQAEHDGALPASVAKLPVLQP